LSYDRKEVKDMEGQLREISENLMEGNASRVKELVQASLDSGVQPQEIMEHALVSAMSVIGEKFKKDEIYMPEVMIAARAMNAGLEVLDPLLSQTNQNSRGTIVLGTIKGDLHDVGKNIVSIMFRGAGFKIIDLGINVPEDRFVEALRVHKPLALALSSLLTTSMPALKTTIEAVKAAGLRDQVIIMVGGAPVTQAYADQIGADGYAPDAARAVEKLNAVRKDRPNT
jgi:5-methyltetrahydrofolate--homocysteine methyltransferase